MSESRKHVPCCDEAHAHTSPRCCASECWCIADVRCPVCGDKLGKTEKLRNGNIYQHSDGAHLSCARNDLVLKRAKIAELTREADAYERQIATFERACAKEGT